jgi:chromosome partitioning protein
VATKVLAVANQKGGVGKTSITLGLADVYARRGQRVLVIDSDPQANATAGVGLTETPSFTLNDVLRGQDGEVVQGVITEAAVPAGEGWDGVDVVASELALANREQDQMVGREFRLRTALTDGTKGWDVVLIDCPPSLGQLTINALVSADAALLVTEPRASSVDGLAQIVRTLATVHQHFNPGLRIAGVVVNRHREGLRDRAEWDATIRATYPDQYVDPPVPEREIVAVATSAAAPLSAYGAKAKEVIAALEVVADRAMDRRPRRRLRR